MAKYFVSEITHNTGLGARDEFPPRGPGVVDATSESFSALGPIDLRLTTPGVYSDHQRLDVRSLAMHYLIAKKLLAEASLIDQARRTLARWRAQATGLLPSYFLEWERILNAPPEKVAGFLVSMHADATRLRQSSPFTDMLTPEERSRIYAAFRRPVASSL